MSAYPDTTQIDGHECEMRLVDPTLEPDEITNSTKFVCRTCGTVTTPSWGVTSAKRNRKW